MSLFTERKTMLEKYMEELTTKNNRVKPLGNGIYERWENPVVTNAHVPLDWRYDMNPNTNPWFMERLGINATLNAGAIEWNGKICVILRVEGNDRKSFFAIAESDNGVDNFKFWDYPCVIPETDDPDTNVYDMRLTKHQDGWVYGLFCSERKAKDATPGDESSADAQCGIVRTKDLINWERLPDLVTKSAQQRNVVLHPEFVNGKYALYTRPQDSFIEAGSKGGIGWGLCEDMTKAVVDTENVYEPKVYHTINEVKNGQGPAPIKTREGWIHLAHGVRNTAAGLRYVLYLFMSSLEDPSRVIYRPGGFFIAPEGEERVGDVSNVVFSNGWVAKDNGEVFIYYASSDTRLHVATTNIDRLIDYCKNTPRDPLRSAKCVEQRIELIKKNRG